jgi:two-component system, cell cycle sensor histidine kinase PleC
MFNLVQPIGQVGESGTFMLFVMLLVVAVSSMLAVEPADRGVRATVPVTDRGGDQFRAVGRPAQLRPAAMAVTAQGYFPAGPSPLRRRWRP